MTATQIRSPKRLQALVKQVNHLGQRIGALSEKKRVKLEALACAIGLGSIEVDGRKYIVTKPRGRFVFNVEYELKQLPKNPRSKVTTEAAVPALQE